MERWEGKVAVITGASAGIGLAVAKALVRHGMIVVGLARRRDKMLIEINEQTTADESRVANAITPGRFYARECNVSSEQSVKEAFEYVGNEFGAVGVLVNNAGIVLQKTIEDADMKELEDVVGVNLMGALYCYKHALPLMKRDDQEGVIINMNSIAGHKVPNPSWSSKGDFKSLNVYPVTKFALTALSETCSNELIGSKIRVTNLSPGYVRTEIARRRRSSGPSGGATPALSPDDVADAVLYVVGAPAHVHVAQLTVKPLGEMF